uniref:Uncharacterized protein n=1 Tax=Rhizophora mucronata TaxID=61149 RepID=A0A2P2PHV0_RHIMU
MQLTSLTMQANYPTICDFYNLTIDVLALV